MQVEEHGISLLMFSQRCHWLSPRMGEVVLEGEDKSQW